jgi:ubiquinone/menaquinone biosynthesis C-methylase UbiE
MEMIYYPYPKAPFLDPSDVVSELDLAPGNKVLDFGAGSGYWALPIAQAVGGTGHVYVTDAKPESLSVIKSKARKLGLENLTYFHVSYNTSVMPIQTKVDLILCSNILSAVKDPAKLLKMLKKMAKSGTKLVIVDWRSGTSLGPAQEDKIKTEDLVHGLSKLGFEFKKLLSAGAHHTGFMFVFNE